jgi:hypothetical protein
MKIRTSLFALTCFILSACSTEQAITWIVSRTGKLPERPFGQTQVASTQLVSGFDDPVLNLPSKRRTQEKSFVKSYNAILSTTINVYPGMIVQGESLRQGDIADIGTFPRKPLILTAIGLGVIDTVSNPSLSSVEKSIERIRANIAPERIQAKMLFSHTQVHSAQQAIDSVTGGVNWGIADLNGRLRLESNSVQSTHLICFQQIYYTVEVNQPSMAGKYFADSINVFDLGTKIFPGNPPCFVSKVDYGRIIFVKVTSTASQADLEAEVNGHYTGLTGSYSGGYKKRQTSWGLRASFEAFFWGGSAKGASNVIRSRNIDEIDSLIFDDSNKFMLGTPINYQLRYLEDNTLVNLAKVVSYSEQDVRLDPNKCQVLDIQFDHFKVDATPQKIFTNRPFYYEITVRDEQNNILKTLDGSPAQLILSRSDVLQSLNEAAKKDHQTAQVGDVIPINETLYGVICPKGIEQKIVVTVQMKDIKQDWAKGIEAAVSLLTFKMFSTNPLEDFKVGNLSREFVSPYELIPEDYIEDILSGGMNGYDVKMRYKFKAR